MWNNLYNLGGSLIQKVQTISDEMDTALDPNASSATSGGVGGGDGGDEGSSSSASSSSGRNTSSAQVDQTPANSTIKARQGTFDGGDKNNGGIHTNVNTNSNISKTNSQNKLKMSTKIINSSSSGSISDKGSSNSSPTETGGNVKTSQLQLPPNNDDFFADVPVNNNIKTKNDNNSSSSSSSGGSGTTSTALGKSMLKVPFAKISEGTPSSSGQSQATVFAASPASTHSSSSSISSSSISSSPEFQALSSKFKRLESEYTNLHSKYEKEKGSYAQILLDSQEKAEADIEKLKVDNESSLVSLKLSHERELNEERAAFDRKNKEAETAAKVLHDQHKAEIERLLSDSEKRQTDALASCKRNYEGLSTTLRSSLADATDTIARLQQQLEESQRRGSTVPTTAIVAAVSVGDGEAGTDNIEDIYLDSSEGGSCSGSSSSSNKLYQALADKNKGLLLEIDRISSELQNANELCSNSLEKIGTLNLKVAELTKTADEHERKHTSSTEENMQIRLKLGQLTDDLVLLRNQNEEQEKVKLLQSSEISKLQDALAERDRQLSNATLKVSESAKLVESIQLKASDLQAEIAEKDSKMRQMQTVLAGEGDLKKTLIKLQDTINEREDRLAAFESEGQKLAKKQSDMEKAIRTKTSEVRDKETEITKLKESKEGLIKTIEELQGSLQKYESESTTTARSLSAMHAVSQATADKLSKYELDVQTKSEEITSQKRALESAWNENNELKRSIVELKVDRDDLKRQIGEGASKAFETESTRRDVEQREAVLKATNKQLQEELQRQMLTCNSREESLREEVQDMRKRWQEAVTSRESLASEISNASAPLLRQIATLQETIRTKTDAWLQLESTLSERALRGEGAADVAEHKRLIMEEQLVSVRHDLQVTTQKYHDIRASTQADELKIERLQRSELQLLERIGEFENRLQNELNQKQFLQSSVRDLDSKYKMEMQEYKDSTESSKKQAELAISKLSNEVEFLKKELTSVTESHSHSSLSMGSPRSTNALSSGFSDPSISGVSSSSISGSSSSIIGLDGGDSFSITSSTPGRKNVNMMMMSPGMSTTPSNGILPSGDSSYAYMERLQQVLRQKEEDISTLSRQMKQLQTTRDALMDEVAYLGNKTASLEEDLKSITGNPNGASGFAANLHQLAKLTVQNDLLLTLLGEKEEELEHVQTDLKDVKDLYKDQIEALMERLLAFKS